MLILSKHSAACIHTITSPACDSRCKMLSQQLSYDHLLSASLLLLTKVVTSYEDGKSESYSNKPEFGQTSSHQQNLGLANNMPYFDQISSVKPQTLVWLRSNKP